MAPTRDARQFYSVGLHGHDKLDRVLGGGLPTGSLVVVEGHDGTGKSTLAGRFSYGLCEQSHSVTHISTEHSLISFLGQMRSHSYDVKKSLLRRELLFLHGTVANDDEQKRLRLLSRLTAAQQVWANDVVVFNRFSDILLYDSTVERLIDQTDQQEAIESLIRFFRRIMATGTTVVLTISPGGIPESVLELFRSVADVLLSLSVSDVSPRRKHTLSVRRFVEEGRQMSEDVPFFIRPGSGIVIDNSRVV